VYLYTIQCLLVKKITRAGFAEIRNAYPKYIYFGPKTVWRILKTPITSKAIEVRKRDLSPLRPINPVSIKSTYKACDRSSTIRSIVRPVEAIAMEKPEGPEASFSRW